MCHARVLAQIDWSVTSVVVHKNKKMHMNQQLLIYSLDWKAWYKRSIIMVDLMFTNIHWKSQNKNYSDIVMLHVLVLSFCLSRKLI